MLKRFLRGVEWKLPHRISSADLCASSLMMWQAGLGRVKANLASRVKKGGMSQQAADTAFGRLKGTLDYNDFKSVDMVGPCTPHVAESHVDSVREDVLCESVVSMLCDSTHAH